MGNPKTPESRSRSQRIIYSRANVRGFAVSDLLDLDPTPETPKTAQLNLTTLGEIAISLVKKFAE